MEITPVSLPLRKRLGESLCLQEVFECLCLDQRELIQIQKLKRRFYNNFGPALIPQFSLFTITRGFSLISNQSHLDVLNRDLGGFEKLRVFEEASGMDKQQTEEYFLGKDRYAPPS